MPKGPIRRAQLIAPFGVGALSVTKDGSSVITCGLDHWFEREDRDETRPTNPAEFTFEEWRLQRELGISSFRMPPDHRTKFLRDQTPNMGLTIPFLRFPLWHVCPYCYNLKELPSTQRSRPRCAICYAERKSSVFLVQVPFVGMCDAGHLQDFPFREWVHRSNQPACLEPLKLYSTGGSSLAAQFVECGCNARRDLGQITFADPDGNRTHLSSTLSADRTLFLCGGHKPWLGTGESDICTRPLRGSLRSASNLYYADVRSALYLPRKTNEAPSHLVSLLEQPPLSSLIRLLHRGGGTIKTAELREQHSSLLEPYTDAQLTHSVSLVLKTDVPMSSHGQAALDEESEVAFRREEYARLIVPQREAELFVQAVSLEDYEDNLGRSFSKLRLIHRLRETRAFTGFTRVFPENEQTVAYRQSMLRKPEETRSSWLPAYIVYGEGIFFEFNEELLACWEQLPNVRERMKKLANRSQQMKRGKPVSSSSHLPRLVLLHTFAHLLINRLTFECGYSTSAIRERLYVSGSREAPMAGVLIYTAAGDAEGTLGGLVRTGKAGNLEPVIRRALEAARWCSLDPVCMEMGRGGGQGPDSCNLAACHSCALIPETACEHFNRLLDRACLVGDPQDATLGYFTT